MTRLFEIIVACILVAILAVVVGLLLPSHGHVERSIEISHNLRHTYDALNNFRKFEDYAALSSLDPRIQYERSGPAYGVGSTINWQSNEKNVGNGSLEITSNEVDKEVVWGLHNQWRGTNKHYTLKLDPSDNQRLIKITMSYDVDYGWDLVSRYSQLYLEGHPATFMQYTLDNLQKALAHIANVPYKGLEPVLVDVKAQPLMMMSTRAQMNLDDIAVKTREALDKIHAAMEETGVTQVGPYRTLTTNWGQQEYSFTVAVPISSSELTFGERVVNLNDAPEAKSLAEQNLASLQEFEQANAESEAETEAAAESETGEAEAVADADADGDSAAPAITEEGPGTFDDDGTLIVTEDVHAKLSPAGRALMATLHGSPAQLPNIRLALKAFAAVHGYDFNEYAVRLYDSDVSAPDNDTYDSRDYRVYLPVSDAPAETPWQIDNPEKAKEMISGKLPEQDNSGEVADESASDADGETDSTADEAAQ